MAKKRAKKKAAGKAAAGGKAKKSRNKDAEKKTPRARVQSAEVDVKVSLNVQGTGRSVDASGAPVGERGPTGAAPRGGDADAQEARLALQDRKLELQVAQLEGKVEKERRAQMFQRLGIQDPAEKAGQSGSKELPDVKGTEPSLADRATKHFDTLNQAGIQPEKLVMKGLKAGGALKNVVAQRMLGKLGALKLAKAAAVAYAVGKTVATVVPAVQELLGLGSSNPISDAASSVFSFLGAAVDGLTVPLKQARSYTLIGVEPPNLLSRGMFEGEKSYWQHELENRMARRSIHGMVGAMFGGSGNG